MKKRLSIFSGLMFFFITSNSVIACSNPFVDNDIIRVAVITNGYTVADHSFNESSWQGALQFQKEWNNWKSKPKDLQNKKVVVSVIQPTSSEISSFIQAYGQAHVMNSNVAVVNGFVQQNALVQAQNSNNLKNKLTYIFVDGDTDNSSVPRENKNLAGLVFKAEQSGFLAGIAAGIWLLANADKFDKNNLSMSTFGGLDIPPVTNYMFGFYWAVRLLDSLSHNDNKKNENFKKIIKSWIKKLNNKVDESKALLPIKFGFLSNQFSGNFGQASDGSKAINRELVNQNNNVIFPVSGPQIADTLGAIKSSKKDIMVIGVDTDQQQQYSESADRFITSALKRISSSVNYMLWRSLNRDDSFEHKEVSKQEIEKIFKENAESRGGTDFIGIANNEPIKNIYNDIMESKELAEFIKSVSNSWDAVDKTSDIWKHSIQEDSKPDFLK